MDGEHITVLLIEDNPGDARLIQEMLAEVQTASFDLEWANLLSIGLERLAEGGINVVLLDLGLPDSQELDAFAKVSAQAPGVPIVVLTGLADETAAIQALQKGAQECLAKEDVNSAMLARVLRYSIERHRLLADLAQRSQELQYSEARIRQLTEENADGIVVVGRDGIVRFVNPAAEALFGRQAEDLLGESFGFPMVASERTELDIVRKDGETAIAEMQVVETVWEGETVYLASLRDITVRKQAGEALRESEREKALILSSVSELVAYEDNELRIRWANRAAAKSVGLSVYELVGRHCYEIWPQRGEPCIGCPVMKAIETGEPQEQEMTTPDGRVWFIRGYPVLEENGDVVGAVEVTQDITQRKRAEEALAQERDLLQALMDNTPDTIYFKDTASRFTRINRAQAQVLGVTDPKEAIGKTDFDFFTTEHARNAHADEQEIVKSGRPLIDKVERIRRADGQLRWVSATKVPIVDEKGRVTGTVGVSRDVTPRKRAEEEVQRHLEQIEALREIDRAITSTLDLTGVLDIILTELERVIHYHSAGIFLFFSNGTARLAAGRGFPDMERALHIAFPVEEDALTCDLLRQKRPMVLADAQADERFLARGGTEHVRSWIGVPLVVKGRALGFLTIDHGEPGVYDEESAEMAEAFAGQVAIAIENARLYEEAQRELAERRRVEEELRQSLMRLQISLESTINVLVSSVEMKDPYTAGHQRRVAELACAIANEMSLPEDQIEGLRMAGLVHDLGKISIPAEILSKPSQLNNLEWGMIQAHPQIGYDILKTVEFPWPVAETVLQHHERINGSGYPQGLSGKHILMKARILAVADVVEAMSSHRPYRPARDVDEALEEISRNRSILYDPEVVDACLKLFAEDGFELE